MILKSFIKLKYPCTSAHVEFFFQISDFPHEIAFPSFILQLLRVARVCFVLVFSPRLMVIMVPASKKEKSKL